MKGTSLRIICRLILMGYMRAESPSIKRMFAILLPTTFPRARLLSPFREEIIPIVSSGELVPNATIVNPMTSGGTPKDFAKDDAPLISKSAPTTKIARPDAR